jgi:MSHA biogenesis protein MshE
MNAFTRAAHESPNFQPLSEVALSYAVEGLTTLDEVMGITAQIEDAL